MGFLCSHLSKVLGVVGIDDGTATVDQQTTVLYHAIAAHLLEAASLCTHPRNEQEGTRSHTTDVLEELSTRSAHHIHQVLLISPLLRLADNLLKETLSLLVLSELEVEAALVGSKSQQDDPLAGISLQEGSDTIFAHVGSHSEGIHIIFTKEGALDFTVVDVISMLTELNDYNIYQVVNDELKRIVVDPEYFMEIPFDTDIGLTDVNDFDNSELEDDYSEGEISEAHIHRMTAKTANKKKRKFFTLSKAQLIRNKPKNRIKNLKNRPKKLAPALHATSEG